MTGVADGAVAAAADFAGSAAPAGAADADFEGADLLVSPRVGKPASSVSTGRASSLGCLRYFSSEAGSKRG